jgi:hypothetical protein
MPSQQDQRYLNILLETIRVCKHYKPKLGHGGKEGYSLREFQQFYRKDPFYHWMGLDNPLMYAAHKAAGGMTSIYRQIGIGCERLFRTVLQDTLSLSEEDVKWSYTIPQAGRKSRVLYLDGRIPLQAIPDPSRKKRARDWMDEVAQELEIDEGIRTSLKGLVFEVRQGYKSKDSKRQNADIANAATAYTKGYLPCAAILSQQIDQDIALRYTVEKWKLLTGVTADVSPYRSFYAFMKDIIGYDLAGFFERNTNLLKKEVKSILEDLLATR